MRVLKQTIPQKKALILSSLHYQVVDPGPKGPLYFQVVDFGLHYNLEQFQWCRNYIYCCEMQLFSVLEYLRIFRCSQIKDIIMTLCSSIKFLVMNQ